MRWLIALLLVATVAPASAETLGAWTFTPPHGYKVENAKGRKSYTKVDGAAFCLVGVYEPRVATNDVATDLKKEWAEVIEAQFTASEVNGYPQKETKRRLMKHTIGAKLRSGQQTFYGQLVIVRGGGVVGSVVIMAANASGITACHPAANTVMDSIVVGTPAPPSGPGPVAPAAARWSGGVWVASSSANEQSTNVSVGAVKRRYDFRADGTYSFKSEAWSGHMSKLEWFTVEESGTYKVDGAKVTVSPKSAKGAVRDDKGNVTKKPKVALEKVTYEWTTQHFEGIGETQLVLTPPKPTQRDGAVGNNSSYPKSVLYSSKETIEWKY